MNDRTRGEPHLPETPARLLDVSGLCIDIATPDRLIQVVSDVSFAIAAGEAVALVGESGSGKTLTALSILGLLPAAARATGNIRYKGRDLVGMREAELNRVRGRQIAVVFQEPMSSLNPAFTVGEQIAETLRHHMGLSRAAARQRTIDLLAMVGIPQPARRVGDYPHMFSGGMLQRVGIAMALSCEPDLMIADEPTTALDATVQAQMIELLIDLRDRSGTSLLLLTHDFGVVASLCDRAEVMYCGQIVESAPVEALFDRPMHPYTEGLIGAMARLDREGEPRPIPGSVPLVSSFPDGCRFNPRCAYRVQQCTAGSVPVLRLGERSMRCHRSNELELVGSA